jgi:3-deoxy-D-manno-octulosonic acid kinase
MKNGNDSDGRSRMMKDNDVRLETAGAILFDAARSPQVADNWFEPAFWAASGALRMQAGGRGGVAVIETPAGACVLRHYRRGGAVAALLGDRYLWRGAERTRSFAELRLLAEIARLNLPGPRPLAARYQRHGAFYQADLITLRIADSRTLAECLAAGQLDSALAARVGELVARFHRAGIWHADLNAHNVLVGPQGLFLIDFDRGGRRRIATSWRQGNLRRLRRSLLKLGAAAPDAVAFEVRVWQPLLLAYQRSFAA